MAYYSSLNFTVRRKDRMPIENADLERFESFFFDQLQTSETWSTPHVCMDGTQIFASCQVFHTLEEDDVLDFSKSNPHLQIEVIEDCEDSDVKTRYLFEGDICEACGEICYFEEPKLIDWKE